MCCVSGEGTHSRGQDEGPGSHPRRKVGRPLADPTPKAHSHRKWCGSSRKAGAPQERLGKAEARPVLLDQQQLWLNLWPRMSPASCGDAESPITEWPCLAQRCLGMGGPELGWQVPSWGDQEEMGAGTLVLRACVVLLRG